LILIKPFFSDLGYLSFGRIWQYHSSWFEFGFVRRSLVATILDLVGTPFSKENPYLAPYVIYSIILMGALNLFAYQYRTFIRENFVLSLVVFFSPAFFVHLSYTTGNFDVISLIIFYFLINSKRAAGSIILITLGILNHEIFILFLPLYIFSEYVTRRNFLKFFKKSLFITLATLVNIYVFLKIATPKMEQNEFEELMTKKLGSAANKHTFWSGYLELSPKSPLEYQEKYGIQFEMILKNIGYVITPMIFAMLTFIFILSILRMSRFESFLLLVSSLAPFFLSLIFADDFYRYLSLSLSGLLIVFLKIYQLKGLRFEPDRKIYILLVFCLLGPLGSGDLARPFPVLQKIIEIL
jgi:hypothetical protein